MILVYIERKSKFTTLFNQLADKIINE